MLKMFVGNLPQDATEESVHALFSQFGTVRSVQITTDIFSGRCRGFGFVEMEGHEARKAINSLDGKSFGDKSLRVCLENPRNARGRKRR